MFVFGLSLLAIPSVYAQSRASIDAGRGPEILVLPTDYEVSRPVPLIISLHGFGGTGESFAAYWEHSGQIERRTFMVSAPQGRKDSKGKTFWNATDACCDKDKSGQDDSAYLRALIEAIEAKYAIDPRQIHVSGYSNGGFMAHRMACDHADKVASVLSIAGSVFADPGACQPSEVVHVLQVHGMADPVIQYGGGGLKNYGSHDRVSYPSARGAVASWARRNGIESEPRSLPALDLSDRVKGAETAVLRYGGEGDLHPTVELWSLRGEHHVPQLNDNFYDQSTDWLLDHAKVASEAK